MRYFLFRYGTRGSYGYRMKKAETVEQACKLAFGVVYHGPHNGDVVYKCVGTRSPKYIAVKVKQTWYTEDGWSVIPARTS